MHIKKLFIIILFSSEIIYSEKSNTIPTGKVTTKSWLSGIKVLDDIEQESLIKIYNICCTIFSQAWDTEISQKELDKIINKASQEKNKTIFSKNISEVSNVYFSKHIKSSKSYCKLIEKLTNEYFPEKIDLIDVFINYSSWGYEYLYDTLNKKNALTISDICYVLEQFTYYMKKNLSIFSLFSLKKSNDMWIALINAINHGMKKQSPEVKLYFIKNIENIIKDPDLKKCFDLIKTIKKSRQEIINKASKKEVHTKTLKSYKKSIDELIIILKNLIEKHIDKKNKSSKLIAMLDKLLVVEAKGPVL